jgi:hypothetical protein
MAERKLSLIILGKATSALAAMKSVGDEAGSLGKKVTDLLPSMKTVALAGAAAFGAVAAAAYGAVQAAAQDEQSQKKLADQLRRTTQATDEQIAAVEQHISKQMMLTGVTDDELRPAMANLVRAIGDVNAAQQALILAQDISAATGKDLESVSLALGKAYNGSITALTKLGVPLDQAAVKSKNLTQLTKSLQDQFGGAAADSADTFSGRLRILQVSLGEAVEGIGYALLPAAEMLVAFVQKRVVPVIQAFSDKLAAGGGLRDALIAGAAQMGTFAFQVISIAEKIAVGFVTLGNAIVAIGKPMLVVIGNLAAGLTLLFTGSFSKAQKMFDTFEKAYLGLDALKVNTQDVVAEFAKFRTEVVAMQKLNAALATTDLLSRRYGQTVKDTGSAQDDFLKVLKGLSETAGGAGGKVKQVADAMKTYTDALSKARDATRSQADATRGVQKAQTDLAAKTTAVAAAQARFDTVMRGFPATAKESIAASRRFADAQRGVRDAGLQVADAVRGVQDAEQRLAELRAKQADAAKVAGAERSLERSKYGVEEANFRVADAERELAELRADPNASAIDLRRAEIALAEAKLGVSDAVQSVADAEKRLADERNMAATADELADAERNLERAEYAVTDALDAQRRATDEQSDAQQHLNEITYGAVIGSVAHTAALKELDDAKQAQVEASDALADALRREADAMRDLIAAQKALLEVQAATKPRVQAAAQAALGVSVGAGGAISEAIGTVSASGTAAAAPGGTLNVRVETSPFVNPQDVGAEVVDALAAYLRSNGTIPIPVGSFLGVV